MMLIAHTAALLVVIGLVVATTIYRMRGDRAQLKVNSDVQETFASQGRQLASHQEQIGTLHTLVGRMYLARHIPLPDAHDRADRAEQWKEFDQAYSDFQAIVARIDGTANEPGS